MAYFVFLEFTNPKLRNFLGSLNEQLMGEQGAQALHVTVRGPYDTAPDKETLELLKEKLQGYGVAISGSGIFETPKGYAVYLAVKSKLFSEIWWKPDFKEEQIKPHITIYETPGKEAAKKVNNFFRKEKIEIFTLGITLTVYKSKQLELFEETIDPKSQEKLSLLERWTVKPGILERAAKLRIAMTQKG